ncbi:DUF2796 domain-containing protein [Maricurvus nonylphenolicus]|uniref:ZrgA family zinc uptake protein n=1 Tax=Maricurvus nonylphenolicus TaxID=1008307 RepID=UPI0036F33428
MNNNRFNKKRFLLVSTLALLGSAGAFAADGHDDDQHTSHGAHVHGEAALTMALEGSDVEIVLESPAANIIGFEYKAATEEEKRIEKQAADALKAAGMFTFSGAACELEKVVVVLPGADHDDHGDDHHDEHKDHHDKHDDDHHDKHDDHHDKHEDEHDSHAKASHSDEHHDDEHHDEHKSETHSEVTANYHYHCENLSKLEQVDTGLFKQFPKLEKIDAMWVSATGQGAVELSAEKSVMKLK